MYCNVCVESVIIKYRILEHHILELPNKGGTRQLVVPRGDAVTITITSIDIIITIIIITGISVDIVIVIGIISMASITSITSILTIMLLEYVLFVV